jgi:hypothetical protein
MLQYYPRNTAKYTQHILYRRLNTVRVYSEYAERMENMQKEIFSHNNAVS